ncbi:MAG: NfeD family protein [Candidatus Methylomirabilia bacterium]
MWCHLLFFGFPVLGLSLFWLFPFLLAPSLYLPLSALSIGAGVATIRTMRSPVSAGSEAMRGREGRVETVEGKTAVVRVGNELWKAVAPEPLALGQGVLVVSLDGLTLTVRAFAPREGTSKLPPL